MRRFHTLIAVLFSTGFCYAQTLQLKVDCVNYMFPASTIGEMTFSEGKTLTIKDRVFTLDEVSLMTTKAVTANTVSVEYDNEIPLVSVSDTQYASTDACNQNNTNRELFATSLGGMTLNFQMSGITKVELESVDAMGIAGRADKYIITFCAPEGNTLSPNTDYCIIACG